MRTKKKCGVLILMCIISVQVFAQQTDLPYAAQQIYPMNLYWGDTHLHTSLSLDAYGYGGRLSPDDAYRFAKGKTVTTEYGLKVRLKRPLDFLVIADHANKIGFASGLEKKDKLLLDSEWGKRWYAEFFNNPSVTMYNLDFVLAKSDTDKFEHFIWEKIIANADRNNDPGKFTAFIGYEWTSFGIDSAFPESTFPPAILYNLHRVVVFKDGADKAGQLLPFSLVDSGDPEDLWKHLARYRQETGGDVLAIPHNGNLSNGAMFAETDYRGNPIDAEYARNRSYWEPLYEVTQIKGDSETYPVLSPNDEFADYERWGGWYGQTLTEAEIKTLEKDSVGKKELDGIRASMTPEKKQYEYARSALKLGLKQQGILGVNPFSFGLIGSTDSHIAMSAVEENNFIGKYVDDKPRENRITEGGVFVSGWENVASGYAAVWATDNTRAALFDAMKRKEVYATTGPRITVRFFGGWDYDKDDAFKPDLALNGYRKGVPMGGDLTSAAKGQSPRFLIHAMKDPDGANLDRVQVIKGWLDPQGETHEKIYNVALSDGRQEDNQGNVPPVGNTVDIGNAAYTNTIGDPVLAAVWEDPDFCPEELSFYYLRVLEIPTPRWTAYDAKFFGLRNLPKEIPMVIQERAYTSPIWYTP